MEKKISNIKEKEALIIRTVDNDSDLSIGDFHTLPLSKQRAILTRALQSKQTKFIFGDTIYEVPLFVQVTYRCSSCGASKGMRMYSSDFLNSQISKTLQCHHCRKFKLEQIMTSAPLDYSLDRLHKAKGLYKYLSKKQRDFQEE